MSELEEARRAVASAEASVSAALVRCRATLAALRSNAPVADLPKVASDVMAELDSARAALADMHRKAEGFAQQVYALRHENDALLDFLGTLSDLPTPDERARAAHAMLNAVRPVPVGARQS